MNPAHEQRSGALIREVFPEAHISLSCEVLSRVREWPRLSATLLNAYLAPVLVTYIADLEKRLNAAGVTTQQRFLMQSNGGVMPFAAAVTGHKTVHSLLVRPGGRRAGKRLSAARGASAARGLVTLDMGGTSCDIAFIEGGAPLEVTEGTVARRQLDVPALDLTTISAGGGSIVWIDRAGFLSVGPQSAGADPGPVCYGRGGENPTVTDADIVCGFLNPDYFLGGTQKLDAEAARAALEATIAKPMGMIACGGRRRHPPHRRYAHGRRGAGVRGAARRRSQRIRAACRSAAPARCMPPRSPRNSACAASSCRRGRVRSRRSGCSAPTCCTTTSAPSCARSIGSIRRMPRSIFREIEAKAASELAEEGLDPKVGVVRARIRYALCRARVTNCACRSTWLVAE